VFLPPTAIPLVTTLSEFIGSGAHVGFENVPVLDGANSFQAGNGTITSWNWTITNTTGNSTENWSSGGEQLVAPFVSTGYGNVYTYSIVLKVQDSNDLLGLATTTYSYHP
jgi:hypothetical protein